MQGGRVFGYTRPLSSAEEKPGDIALLRSVGVSEIVTEESHESREARQVLIGRLVAGDTLVVSSLKRLEVRLPDLVRLAHSLRERGITIHCLDAPAFSSGDSIVRQLLGELAAFQEQHVGAMIRRSLAESPAKTGRPSKIDAEGREVARKMRAQSATYREIGAVLGVSASAVSRALSRDS